MRVGHFEIQIIDYQHDSEKYNAPLLPQMGKFGAILVIWMMESPMVSTAICGQTIGDWRYRQEIAKAYPSDRRKRY